MTDIEIISVIDTLDKECEKYKDGGMTFISELAKKLDNTIDKEKEEVFQFFLREIESREHGNYWTTALYTIKEMQAIELAPSIENIYRHNQDCEDDDWKYNVIDTLMFMEYDKPKDIYEDFINYCIEINHKGLYYLLVQYCNIDFDYAIPLLSSFCADYYYGYDVSSCDTNGYPHGIVFLVNFFFRKNEINRFRILIELIAQENKKTAIIMKTLIEKLLNSRMIHPKDKEKAYAAFSILNRMDITS